MQLGYLIRKRYIEYLTKFSIACLIKGTKPNIQRRVYLLENPVNLGLQS